jgi:hypothetical protein
MATCGLSSTDPPVMRFDASGRLGHQLRHGMIVQAHGMTVDRDGNVWVTDAQIKEAREPGPEIQPDGSC